MQITVTGNVDIQLENSFERQVIKRALELYVAHEESNTEKEALCNSIIAEINKLPGDL